MKGLVIVCGVLLALAALSIVRVGGVAKYSEGGFFAFLRVGPIRFQLYPAKKKSGAEKKKKEKHPAQGGKAEAGGPLRLFKALAPDLLDAVKALKRKVRIDDISLVLTVAAADPAAAAMAFGGANALIGMIWPLIENNFNVRKRTVKTGVDFESSEPSLYLSASFSLTVGQLVSLGLHHGVKLLKQYRQYQKAYNADRKADSYGKEPSHQ